MWEFWEFSECLDPWLSNELKWLNATFFLAVSAWDGAEKILLLGAPKEDPFEPLEVSPLTTNLLANETAPVAELFNELFFVPLQEDIDPFVIFRY